MNVAARVAGGGAAGDIAAPPGRAIGEILLARGAVGGRDLAAALALQPERGCRLGELLCAHGWAAERDVAAALADQWRLALVDLADTPPDPALIAAIGDPGPWLDARTLPWRMSAGQIVHVTDDPGRARASAQAADAWTAGDGPPPVELAIVTTADLDAAFQRLLGPALAARAARRTAPHESVRTLGCARLGLAAGLALAALLLAHEGRAVVVVVAAILLAVNALTTLLRLSALVAGRPGERLDHAPNVALIRWPRLSLLVPLYRETPMVPEIAAALAATDYPRELLDVKILIEADDPATRAALAAAALPGWISVLTVPEGAPRTKPRALNYALDFCRGEIVGILDAEDRPDADQFRRVARHLMAAPPEVACVQCQLSYFNTGDTWITRCFQIEYSIWFDVLLRGFQRLGLPIPLGGTSVYFRRAVLPELGGWDAHNVTEDADLGMRLARRGLRCEVVDATTHEEASGQVLPWIRQRSRWLKGYLLTWLSHMRAPRRLWRDLGPAGFVGFNVLLLGGALSYLAMPLFWLSVAAWLGTGRGLWGGTVPDALLAPLGVMLAFGQAVMLGCAVLAMRRRGTPRLICWVPVLPFYWTLGAIAAWKAVAEFVVAPYYWDKTCHGQSAELRRARAAPGGGGRMAG